jgi:hypothetical protein
MSIKILSKSFASLRKISLKKISSKRANLQTISTIALEYLVAAGGGSGGGGDGGAYGGKGAGGGAGGLLIGTQSITGSMSGLTYAIVVGYGGVSTSTFGRGNSGADSSLTGTSLSITCKGGGGGGAYTQSSGVSGLSGGSGGGSAAAFWWNGSNSIAAGPGRGVYPGSTYLNAPRQGYDGGAGGGTLITGSLNTPRAGGGAGGPGNFLAGAGIVSTISGSSVTYCSGGLAGTATTDLSPTTTIPGHGGAGGASGYGGQAGTFGNVIIRYPDTYPAAVTTTGSPTITVAGGYRTYKWSLSGTWSITF